MTARRLLVDTSAAVPLLVADHAAHATTLEALRGAELGLAGHAAFETYSVLTRLPPPARRAPGVVQRLLAANFPIAAFLSADGAADVFGRLAASSLAGGSVYDALVGAAAAEHDLPLVTRDRRALDTYGRVGASVELLDDETTHLLRAPASSRRLVESLEQARAGAVEDHELGGEG